MSIWVGQMFYDQVYIKVSGVSYLKIFFSNTWQYNTMGLEQENKKTLRLLKKPDKDIRFLI